MLDTADVKGRVRQAPLHFVACHRWRPSPFTVEWTVGNTPAQQGRRKRGDVRLLMDQAALVVFPTHESRTQSKRRKQLQ